eukprot:813925-Rhodomonas_salina.1
MESTSLPLCTCPNTLLFGRKTGEEGCGCKIKYRHRLGLIAIQQLLLTFREFKEELAEFRLANPHIDNATHEQVIKTLSSKPCHDVNICHTMHESIDDRLYALAWFERSSGMYGPEIANKFHGWQEDCDLALRFIAAAVNLLESWADDLRQTLGDNRLTRLPDDVLEAIARAYVNK